VQLNSLKEHIVGCAHCQAILSQLEATDQISLPAAERGEAVTKQPKPLLAAAHLETARAAEAAPPKKSRRVLLLRGARWQWLAPAGAIAASLLVWIATHENHPLAPAGQKQVQVATNQAPPPPPSPVSRTVPEPSVSAKAIPAKPQSAADEFTGANARSASGTLKPRAKQDYLAQASPQTPLADKEHALRKDAGRESSTDRLRAEEQLDRDAKTADGARLESAQAQTQQLQVQDANVQSQNQSNANSPKAPGPVPRGQMEAKKTKAASAAPAPPPPQPGVAGGIVSSYNDSAALEVSRAITNPRLISPPGSNLIWRVGRSGLIELSRDGGSSWSRQISGVLADLLTGSAPSDQVCWVVGRAGSILLTTDGGAHWKLLSPPMPDDLGGVEASDALHARVWNSLNTKSFETSDGGVTWKRFVNE
jgi:Photosynthesis system II assembly factor YCF48